MSWIKIEMIDCRAAAHKYAAKNESVEDTRRNSGSK